MRRSYILELLNSHLEKPNPDSALALIRYFHERLQEGRAVDEQLQRDDAYLLEYMGHVFEKIRAGAAADQALGLKLGKGKYFREDTTWRDMSLAAFAIMSMRGGQTWEKATGGAADAYCVSESTAQRAYAEHESGLGCLSDRELKTFLGDRQPLSP